MKKKLNKKGFSIVEMLIVIAVIGILAAVLIPTFPAIVESAQKSARLQNAQNTLKMALAAQSDAMLNNGTVIQIDDEYHFIYTNGKLGAEVSKPYGNTSGLVVIKSTLSEDETASDTLLIVADLPDNVVIFMTKTDADQITSQEKTAG